MDLMHCFLIIPPTILSGYYLLNKLRHLLPVLNTKKRNLITLLVLETLLVISAITLSPVIAILFYTIIFSLFIDLLVFILKNITHYNLVLSLENMQKKGLLILMFAGCFTLYGIITAQQQNLTEYKIKTIKELNKPINIILLTDLHLGTGTSKGSIDNIINLINKENIDLFIIAGDLFDEATPDNLKKYTYNNFNKIKTTYGTYLVEGNHDLLTNSTRTNFNNLGIKTLEDKSVLIDNSFYLIGRKDKGKPRKSLEELLKVVNPKYPLILVDHRPENSKEAYRLGIDLQLAGHTHAGQIFPLNLFVKYGIQKKDNYNLIISSGFGNWGINIRTTKRNELVKITLSN